MKPFGESRVSYRAHALVKRSLHDTSWLLRTSAPKTRFFKGTFGFVARHHAKHRVGSEGVAVWPCVPTSAMPSFSARVLGIDEHGRLKVENRPTVRLSTTDLARISLQK